jgi:Na+/phosphate symporter
MVVIALADLLKNHLGVKAVVVAVEYSLELEALAQLVEKIAGVKVVVQVVAGALTALVQNLLSVTVALAVQLAQQGQVSLSAVVAVDGELLVAVQIQTQVEQREVLAVKQLI